MIQPAAAQRIRHPLSAIFPSPKYDLPPEEVVFIEIHRPTGGPFNVIHIPTGQKADCYPSTALPFFRWAMDHRRRVRIQDCDFWGAPPEYVVLWKLEFYREGGGDKHLRDIRGILAVPGEDFDRGFVANAAPMLGLHETWQIAERYA
ncbi:MAG: hypothetical protein SFU53_01615 [Terrimicrobiaceae bacterium]|nr:hypothetical protein [Terrimicrobiaceae bacterium]